MKTVFDWKKENYMYEEYSEMDEVRVKTFGGAIGTIERKQTILTVTRWKSMVNMELLFTRMRLISKVRQITIRCLLFKLENIELKGGR